MELKNNLQRINSRVNEAQNPINDLKHKEAKKQPIRKTTRKKNPKKEDSARSLWDNFKHSNIRIIGLPEGEEKDIGNLLEKIVKENFPNLVKETDMQDQEAQRVPNKMDTMRPTPIHVIIKLPKVKYKDRILKVAREKQRVTYKGAVSYTHLTLPTTLVKCRSRWSPYH